MTPEQNETYEGYPYTEYTEDEFGIECEECGKHFFEPGLCDNCFAKHVQTNLHAEITRLTESLETTRAEVARLEQDRERVRREALLEAAKVMCYDCFREFPIRVHPNDDTVFMHIQKTGKLLECGASEIRKLLADQGQGQTQEQ